MRRIAAIGILVFISGCAAYKELSPSPGIVPRDQGYIELKTGKDNFALEQGKKYFIRFPRPEHDNFYLVIQTNLKPALVSYLASAFDDGAPPAARIADETPSLDSLFVYPIDLRAPEYFWVIDTVRYDAELAMHYRYAPRWRFTFERRSAVIHTMLIANRIDPTPYNVIGPTTSFEGLDVVRELATVDARTNHLRDGKKELEDLAHLLPPDIASRRDTTYDNYLLLKSDLTSELTLQENYGSVLRVLDRVQATKGDAASFLRGLPTYTDFLDHKDRQRPPVVERMSSLLAGRLSEAEAYYDGLLRSKRDADQFTPTPPVESALTLYKGLGKQPPQSFVSLVAFVERFNIESAALRSAQAKLGDIEQRARKEAAWTSEPFYSDMINRVSAVQSSLPASILSQYGGRNLYPCAQTLIREMSAATTKATSYQSLYQRGAAILADLRTSSWPSAESRLRELDGSTEYEGVPTAVGQRADIVARLDEELFSLIQKASQGRVDAFVARNESVIDNVGLLYADSAFVPVYSLTFSAGGAGQLLQRKKQITDYLNDARHVRFPGTAIRTLYAEFVRDPAKRGVEHARAIVEHGREYTGTDKQITGMVSECDVNAPKWIAKPKEYRKIYALPLSSNLQGENQYMVRCRIQVPTDADFPVFDVNVKLPREIAEKAGSASWFTSMTIDGKPIKNEGRFRITAPNRENNYESLISPVQMDKEGKHILEIRFAYPGFRVFEISAMAQVPIIRKN